MLFYNPLVTRGNFETLTGTRGCHCLLGLVDCCGYLFWTAVMKSYPTVDRWEHCCGERERRAFVLKLTQCPCSKQAPNRYRIIKAECTLFTDSHLWSPRKLLSANYLFPHPSPLSPSLCQIPSVSNCSAESMIHPVTASFFQTWELSSCGFVQCVCGVRSYTALYCFVNSIVHASGCWLCNGLYCSKAS